jgi:hypothetical protein
MILWLYVLLSIFIVATSFMDVIILFLLPFTLSFKHDIACLILINKEIDP